MARAEDGSAFPPLYLRDGLTLVPEAPTATLPRDDVTAFIGAGQRIVLAEFLSEPATEDLVVPAATAVLFLVTGRTGMEGCAEVVVEVARRTPLGERFVRGAGVASWSILPRRDSVEPVEVRIGLQEPLAATGDRVALAVAVENRCEDARGPVLLYDALGFASVVRFGDEPVTTSTTTTTTTTTDTTTTNTRPTATTLPFVPGCLVLPLTGYDAVWCRLDILALTLGDELPEDFGGTGPLQRLQRRLARARQLVRSAQVGEHARRNLRRGLQQLAGIGRMIRLGQRRGRVDADVAAEVAELVAGAVGELVQLR